MPMWYLGHSFQNSILNLYGHVTWTFSSKSIWATYSAALRRSIRETRRGSQKKIKEQAQSNSSSFAAQLFAVSLIQAFVKTGRPPGPQTRPSHPADLVLRKGFVLF